MSFDLDKIKLEQFSEKLQITIFDITGKVLESCDSVLEIDRELSVFDQFLFLKSLEEVFTAMPDQEEQRFSEVEWEEGKHGLFHLVFKKLSPPQTGPVIQWTIIDNTFYYDKLLKLQQSRNDSAISEEFAQIKKRVIEAEKGLLEFKNQELQRIQEFKSEFFAKVSHEMRTPLNSITGLADLLGDDKDGYLSALKSTSKHLNSIINDILDLSKIESGNLEFESIDFNLQSTVLAITNGFQFACQKKGIELRLSVPDQAILLKGDPTRLSQVIYNLLGNSIKFTERGLVELDVSVDQPEENSIQVLFSISDTGVGMDTGSIDRILEPYKQASKETSRLYGGTGLGLSIAKQLIENFGGSLSIESQIDKGTRMSFSISFHEGEAAEEPGTDEVSVLQGLGIILAEDDELSKAVLSQQLTQSGANLTSVCSGEELLLAVKNGSYDLIISDINLPGRSGIDVFNQLRSDGNTMPFIFVSGDEQGRDQISDMHENWAFLLKPVERVALISTVSKMNRDPQSVKVDLTKIRSMIDDEEFVKDLLQTILDTLPEELNKLRKMSSQHDILEARRVLHKIKPSISYLGVSSLIEDRQKLHEEAGKESPDPSYNSDVQRFISVAELALADLRQQL